MQTKSKHPLMQSFASEPLLVEHTRMDVVSSTLEYMASDPEALAMLNARASSGEDFWGAEEHPYRPYVVSDGVLQIPVMGTLINHFGFQFGRWATGYQYIEAALVRGLSDPNVKGIALVVDSGGGMVSGCFELTDKIYAARDVKPIKAFVSDGAYSAAFALSSAANEIVVSRSGGTGSVGVLTAHVDLSGALEKAGIKVTMIYAGEHKVDGNGYEKLPDSVKSRIQDRIDRTYDVFVSTVARNRSMGESAVRDTKALCYDAQDSIAQGFADRVGALDEELVVFAQLAALTEEETMSITQEQMDQAVATARAEGLAAGVAQGKTEGASAEQMRTTAILGSDEAKTRPLAAAMMIDLGVSADKAKEQLAKLPEEAKAAAAPDTAKMSGFEKAMADGNPQVGANVSTEEQKMSVADGIFASVGYAPVNRQN